MKSALFFVCVAFLCALASARLDDQTYWHPVLGRYVQDQGIEGYQQYQRYWPNWWYGQNWWNNPEGKSYYRYGQNWYNPEIEYSQRWINQEVQPYYRYGQNWWYNPRVESSSYGQNWNKLAEEARYGQYNPEFSKYQNYHHGIGYYGPRPLISLWNQGLQWQRQVPQYAVPYQQQYQYQQVARA